MTAIIRLEIKFKCSRNINNQIFEKVITTKIILRRKIVMKKNN